MPTYDEMKARYAEWWRTMKVRPEYEGAVDKIAKNLVSYKTRYIKAAKMTGVPWYVIAALHNRESGADFNTQLAQGDPLDRKSVHVPAGRGPFNSWEDGAYDALVTLKGLDKIPSWPIERICYECERYNGWGYHNHGVPSAYLWSFTNIYRGGKYVADGVWSSSAVDKQCGTMPLIKLLMDEKPAEVIPQAPTPVAGQPDFKGAILAKGYKFFSQPGELNILYIEGMNVDYSKNANIHNDWNDLRLVLDHTGRVAGKWQATVNPGDRYVLRPINSGGGANLAYGQYTAWQVGTHGASGGDPHEALVQTGGTVTVDRDKNRDFKRDGDAKDTGWFGINQHWGYDLPTPDQASAGCLVGRYREEHKAFMALVKRDVRYIANKSFVFTTALLRADDVVSAVRPPVVVPVPEPLEEPLEAPKPPSGTATGIGILAVLGMAAAFLRDHPIMLMLFVAAVVAGFILLMRFKKK